MRISGIVATTALVKRGEVYSRLSVEALEHIESMRGVPVIHGHNPLLLPLGKTERTWVEKSSATEASLHQDIYIVTDEPDTFIHEASRTACVHIPFTESPGKFAVESSDMDNSVTVDMSAVSKESHDHLSEAIRAHDDLITLGFHDRQEEIPIPLIRFVSDMSLAEALINAVKIAILGAAVTGRLSKWAEEGVKWLKNDCIPVLRTYRRHKSQEAISKVNEWIVLAFDARNSGGPLVELVIPSKHDSEIPESSVEKFAEQIELFGDLLTDCDKAVFIYRPDEEKCEFRFALTKKGGVIGTEECYEESVEPHKRWLATKREGTDVWWTLVTKDDGELAMQLYLLSGDHPRSLGYLSVDSSVASTFLEVVDADDGVLRPLRAHRAEQGDSQGD